MTHKPTIYLHAGLHKTGTTAIQRVCRRNRKLLHKRGLIYPHAREIVGSPNQEGQHHLAHAIAGQTNPLSKHDARRFIRHCREEATERQFPLLISTEAVSRHTLPGYGSWLDGRCAYLEQLREFLSDFHVHVLLVLRRQDDFVDSMYRERVSKSYTREFEIYRRELLSRSLRFHDQINLFSKVFDETSVFLYEDLKQGPGLATNLLRQANVDISDLGPTPRTRRSLGPREVALKRMLNAELSTDRKIRKEQNRALARLLRSTPVQRILDENWTVSAPTLWRTPEERQKFQGQFDEENARIRMAWFPDRKNLFPVPDDKEIGEYVGDAPPIILDKIFTLARKKGVID